MLTRRIIPCLDVRAGRVVKGVQFEDLRDAGDPVACARAYADGGADEICFLDITATLEDRGAILDVVERAARGVFVPLTVGGGVRSSDDVRRLLGAGADKVAVNTAALQSPELVDELASTFGSQCIVCAIDAKVVGPARPSTGGRCVWLGESSAVRARSDDEEYRDVLRGGATPPSPSRAGQACTDPPGRGPRWEVFSHAGKKPTGRDAVEWAREASRRGAGEILLTSIDRDGSEAGYDVELTRTVVDAVAVPVIASGGVGNLAHLYDGLSIGGADAVLAASIFHFERHTIREAKLYLRERGVRVRLDEP